MIPQFRAWIHLLFFPSCLISSGSFRLVLFATGLLFRIVHERYFVYMAELLTGAKWGNLEMTYSVITEKAIKDWTTMDERQKQLFADIALTTDQMVPTTNADAISTRECTAIRSAFAQS